MPQQNAAAVFGIPSPGLEYDALIRATPDLHLFWAGYLPNPQTSVANFVMPTRHSMEVWVRWTTVNSNRGIFSNWADGSASATMFWVGVDSTIRFRFNATDVVSGLTPTTGVWYHIVGTYDGTSRHFYVNGNLLGGPTAGASASAVSTPLITHNYVGSGQGDLAGVMADAAIYSRALDAGEASQHYVVGLNRPAIS